MTGQLEQEKAIWNKNKIFKTLKTHSMDFFTVRIRFS